MVDNTNAQNFDEIRVRENWLTSGYVTCQLLSGSVTQQISDLIV